MALRIAEETGLLTGPKTKHFNAQVTPLPPGGREADWQHFAGRCGERRSCRPRDGRRAGIMARQAVGVCWLTRNQNCSIRSTSDQLPWRAGPTVRPAVRAIATAPPSRSSARRFPGSGLVLDTNVFIDALPGRGPRVLRALLEAVPRTFVAAPTRAELAWVRGRLDPDHPGTPRVLAAYNALLSRIEARQVLISRRRRLARGWRTGRQSGARHRRWRPKCHHRL